MGWKAPNRAVKTLGDFFGRTFAVGALVAAPVYLACLLLLRMAKSLSVLVRPVVKILPDWMPAERILSVVLVLLACFCVGLFVRTAKGRAAYGRIEQSLFRKIPGYELFRSLTQRLAGAAQDQAWKPALAEIEQALVPAFIIEELRDGRFTVFVPSVPTPLSGAIYILTADRVHPLDVPLRHVLKAVSRWGSGSKDLVVAMERTERPSGDTPASDVRKVA
jgi:uncharacterized membrane protein